MHSLVILLNAANSSDIERSEKLHTTECERSYSKRKSLYLFQLDYIQLQLVVSSVTSWKYKVQAVPSKKKKKKTSGRKEEKKKTRWKRGEEEKRDGRSLCERGRMRCGRGEEKERKRKKNRKQRKRHKKCTALSGRIP